MQALANPKKPAKLRSVCSSFFLCMALKYFRESVEELHRVTWPTRAQAVQLVIAVIITTIIAALFFGFLDAALAYGWKQLITLATSTTAAPAAVPATPTPAS